jgi:hypothetical protein
MFGRFSCACAGGETAVLASAVTKSAASKPPMTRGTRTLPLQYSGSDNALGIFMGFSPGFGEGQHLPLLCHHNQGSEARPSLCGGSELGKQA